MSCPGTRCVRGKKAGAYQDEVIKHLEDGAAWLVDGSDDRTSIGSQLLQGLHNLHAAQVDGLGLD